MKKNLIKVMLLSAGVLLASCGGQPNSVDSSPSASESTGNSQASVTVYTYAEPTYAWSDDNSTCTATRVCNEDPTKNETETVKASHKREEATCNEDGKDIYTATFENKAFAKQVKEVAIAATGHNYGEPTYEWNDDNSTCTATRVCLNDPTHIETETASASVNYAGEPVCEVEIDAIYTAAFENKAFATQTKVVKVVPAHTYGEPTYVWSEDNSTCTATRVCTKDETHIETEKVDAVHVFVNLSCEDDEKDVYTATFENEAFAEQVKEVIHRKATGHAYGEPTYVWSDDNSTCTATRVCANDPTHIETETVNAVHETDDATCDADGKDTYTATFENPAFEQQVKETTIKSPGHQWGEPTYVWSEDNSTCTAIAVCKTDSSHVLKEVVDASVTEEIMPATEETDGFGTLTATFTNELFSSQVKDGPIASLPTLSKLTFTKKEDGSYSVKGNDDEVKGRIKIPAYYGEGEDRGAVTEVEEEAFYYFENIEKVFIPETVVTIGREAFFSCEAMTDVYLKSGALTTIAPYAFYDCYALTSVFIPKSVQSLGNGAFYYCEALESVSFEEDSALTEIGERCFGDCAALKTIDFVEGITLSTLGYSLVCYSPNLVSLELPDFTCAMEDFTVAHCDNLKTLTLPVTMGKLSRFCISQCGIETLNYKGTVAQFAAIPKEEYWADEIMTNVVHCSDGDVDIGPVE